MACIIIGHGPSPKGKGWGREIDRHTVIRLKKPDWQPKQDYGSRVDYMCASTETMTIMLDHIKTPKEYWAQPKKGTWSKLTEENFRNRAKRPLRIPLEVHLRWNAVFLSLSKPGVPNHSLGMAAITYSCEFLHPEQILLLGFDNMLNPDLDDYIKADRGKWVTRHDWHAENRMLPLVEQAYGVEIRQYAVSERPADDGNTGISAPAREIARI